MLYALRLSERGRFSTAPNPWVGCVIVGADGAVLAEGFHEQKGGPHAEAAALIDLRKKSVPSEALAAATAYVTLEPCHMGPGKTTPACDEALVGAGIRCVHIALLDPDPAFGGGAAFLRSKGVEVTVGAAAEAVRASLAPYLYQRRTGRPWTVLKVASAADGSIACADGTSQWITGPAARAHGQLLRASSQAIMIGSGTALADAPRLTRRLDNGALPAGCLPPVNLLLRVVLDARGQVTAGPLLDTSLAPTLIFTTALAPAEARRAWADAGVEVCDVAAAAEGGGVELPAVLAELGARGVVQLMVEGGGALHGSFLSQRGCAQELRLYVGACALGSTARRWMAAPLAATIDEAPRFKLLRVEALEDDICIEYLLPNEDEPLP